MPASWQEFIDVTCGGRAALAGLSTAEVKDGFLLALTRASGLSLCAQLQRDGRHAAVGPARWFISHAWKCSFLEATDAIFEFFKGRNAAASGSASQAVTDQKALMETVVWFDLFSNSQHNTSEKPFEWWALIYYYAAVYCHDAYQSSCMPVY